jgi:hypothetical protein
MTLAKAQRAAGSKKCSNTRIHLIDSIRTEIRS